MWCADDCRVTIALRPRASNDTARRAKDAMGYTPGGGEERGRLAFVMINRVNGIADGYGAARSIVLGTAIAHELFYFYLLISKEHTKTGPMKAYFNQSDFRKARQGELRFTADEARIIRSAISVTSGQNAACEDAVETPPSAHKAPRRSRNAVNRARMNGPYQRFERVGPRREKA